MTALYTRYFFLKKYKGMLLLLKMTGFQRVIMNSHSASAVLRRYRLPPRFREAGTPLLTAKKHLRTSIEFRRAVLYNPVIAPLALNFVPQHVTAHLQIIGSLDSDVYISGSPIRISLFIRHELLRSINTIKINIRQNLKVKKRSMRQVREFCSSQILATKVLTENIPIKRHQEYRKDIIMNLKHEDRGKLRGVALSGQMDASGGPQLASSVRLFTPEGVEVSYCVEVHCCVFFSPNYIITLPFNVADRIADEPPPDYWPKTPPYSLPALPETYDYDEDSETGVPSYDDAIRRRSLYKIVDGSASQERLKSVVDAFSLQKSMIASPLPWDSTLPAWQRLRLSASQSSTSLSTKTLQEPQGGRLLRSVTLQPCDGHITDFVKGSYNIKGSEQQSPNASRTNSPKL
ncbi:uncharacterized protein LOC135146324 isoform X3 [Zophobas morio]|uniref:uncharacterized protein LOC135146324 isoform X3 n=1 Tax=Zophobas morio TaxID=2755281 RepID=UPI003082F595